MLFSLSVIFLLGSAFAAVFSKLKMPRLLGMIILGIIVGPYALNILDEKIILISEDLRKIALIIILARAGLSLDIKELKKAGRPAVLLCFLPACFEILAMTIIAPKLMNINYNEAAVMGAVVAAVSPAVIVPKMLSIMQGGYGAKRQIPQMIMAGASVDDIFVIVIFTVLTGLLKSGNLEVSTFMAIPTSIISGIVAGGVAGLLLCLLFTRIHMRDSTKIVIFLAVSFLFVTAENKIGTGAFGFSGLLAVMTCGVAINMRKKETAVRLSIKFSKLWVGAELILFVLVGATVDMRYAYSYGLAAVLAVLGALLVRMLGVYISLLKTGFSPKEKLFCIFSYIPKATVQAAIGGIPLSMGLSCGNAVLSVAVISILITAPIGAFIIDLTYKRLLEK